MKTVCVLFGGKSSEYEVSLSSAHAVLSNIDTAKYSVIRIGITKEDGRFYRYDGDLAGIRDGSWCADRTKLCGVTLSLSDGRLSFQPNADGYAPEPVVPDVVFPVLHGRFGEDGTVQGMFAVAGIPVVGCDCASSGVCMDKALTKAVISADTSIRQVECVMAHLGDDVASLRAKCESAFGYPMFVKPCRAGSSVGVTKVKDAASFAAAADCAFREDDKILIERAVHGREIEVAVLEEHGEYTVAIPAEIDLGGSEFYDYDTKYVSDCSSFYLPARLTEAETAGGIPCARLSCIRPCGFLHRGRPAYLQRDQHDPRLYPDLDVSENDDPLWCPLRRADRPHDRSVYVRGAAAGISAP